MLDTSVFGFQGASKCSDLRVIDCICGHVIQASNPLESESLCCAKGNANGQKEATTLAIVAGMGTGLVLNLWIRIEDNSSLFLDFDIAVDIGHGVEFQVLATH